jgi:hypothetical protein
MTEHESEPQNHKVVFDCNVYLDVARVLGSPFTWDSFYDVVARNAQMPVPHPTEPMIDSVRALAVCMSGKFAGGELLQVWTSDHIDDTVFYKATESVTPNSKSGHCGLGWGEAEAQMLLDDLIGRLCVDSYGGTVGWNGTDSNPPLDHEDGLVLGACRKLAGDDPLCQTYCVTNDKGFLRDYQAGKLGNHTRVLPARNFLALVRQARGQHSMLSMRRN